MKKLQGSRSIYGSRQNLRHPPDPVDVCCRASLGALAMVPRCVFCTDCMVFCSARGPRVRMRKPVASRSRGARRMACLMAGMATSAVHSDGRVPLDLRQPSLKFTASSRRLLPSLGALVPRSVFCTDCLVFCSARSIASTGTTAGHASTHACARGAGVAPAGGTPHALAYAHGVRVLGRFRFLEGTSKASPGTPATRPLTAKHVH